MPSQFLNEARDLLIIAEDWMKGSKDIVEIMVASLDSGDPDKNKAAAAIAITIQQLHFEVKSAHHLPR